MDSARKFEFVQKLALDLNRKEVTLPSFPDAVLRVQKALDDPDCSGAQLADAVSLEPVLAARVLVFANSAAHNAAGNKVASLSTAIARIGFQKVKSAAISYAVQQIHGSGGLSPYRNELKDRWVDSLRLAAMAEVIAEPVRGVDADAAFIAGMVHRIGALYIYGQHEEFGDLLSDAAMRAELIQEWQQPVGESIVANWGFPEEIQSTVNPDVDEAGFSTDAATLVDVVIAARQALETSPPEFRPGPVVERLGIDCAATEDLLTRYEAKFKALNSSMS